MSLIEDNEQIRIKCYDTDFIYNILPTMNGRKAKGVLFILHGYSGDVDQWNERAMQARKSMPDLIVYSIQAPIELPYTYMKTYEEGTRKGYTWAKMDTPLQQAFTIADHAFGGMSVYKKLNKFINKELQMLNLKPEDACVSGCSLGGLVGIAAALQNDRPYGLVMGTITSVLPFAHYKSKPEVYLASVRGDEHFDTYDEVSGLRKAFNKSAAKKPGMLNFKKGLARLQKHGVPYVSKVYDVHWEKEPRYDLQANPILDENGNQKIDYAHHRVSVLMWSDALKYVGKKLGLEVTPYVDEMVALGETGKNPKLTI